mgnify:CR=1 FL=1
MSNFLSQLTTSERARLLEELNYMNLEEIRGFCSERAIPYRIVAEYSNGKVKATKDTDRKPIVLARVRRYLRTGQVGQPTRISAQIVREENPPARLGPRDRLYYRWYAKEFEGVMRLLRDLTAGRFRDGAVARVLAMEFWTRGEAPTFEEFARSWTKAKAEEHRLLTPEYAYLTDLRHQRADGDWKALRKAKAKSALETLARIAPVRAADGRLFRMVRGSFATARRPRVTFRRSQSAGFDRRLLAQNLPPGFGAAWSAQAPLSERRTPEPDFRRHRSEHDGPLLI